MIALSTMAYAMQDSGHAALVRRVYRAGSAPRVGALIPESIKDDEGNSQMVIFCIS